MLAHQSHHLTLCSIVVIAEVAINIEQLEFEAAEIKVIIWPLFTLIKTRMGLNIEDKKRCCTYCFKNGANLECSEGCHDLVGSWVAHTVLEGQDTTFLN